MTSRIVVHSDPKPPCTAVEVRRWDPNTNELGEPTFLMPGARFEFYVPVGSELRVREIHSQIILTPKVEPAASPVSRHRPEFS